MSIILDIKSSCVYIAVVTTQTSPQANLVRRQRRANELTQAQLAKLVGVSRQTVISIEGGDYAPSVYLALRIATALDTTVEALFGHAKPPEDTQ